MTNTYAGQSLYGFDIRTASDKVPPEYLLAWEWFEEKGGSHIDRLPFGKYRPEGMPMPLARQAAIHCPSYGSLPSKGAGKKRYALSVYSMGQAVYPDGDKSERSDGTWLLDYHEQRGGDPNQNYNELLDNCMADGVPLGVMVKAPQGGFDVLGLAVVERYDPLSHSFVLHGPVSLAGQRGSASPIQRQESAGRDSGIELPFGGRLDARTKLNEVEYQHFWSVVFDAYDGACAVTDAEIPEILDAALIDCYRGPESLVVQNGILLRADVCRLYDADLLCIEPGSHVVRTSDRLAGTSYVRLDGCEARSPKDSRLVPDEELVEQRYLRFAASESAFG